MRQLGVRLGIILVAVTVLGLSGWGVVVVLLQQRAAVQAQSLRAELVLERLRREARPGLSRAEEAAALARAAEASGVAVALERASGELVQRGQLPPREQWPVGTERAVVGGQLIRIVALDADHVYARAVVAANLMEPPAGHRVWVWSSLALVSLVMIGAGLIFLRRAVVQPLARVTQLVSRADVDGLQSMGGLSNDPFARLGRGVAAMNRVINEERQRIAEQLAALTQSHRELEHAQQQLVRAERLAVVGQLAAGLAHEVGNPLAVVRGFVDILLEDDADPQERKRALERMSRELDRIQSTLRELLDFSRAPQSSVGIGQVEEAMAHVEALLSPQERWRTIELTVQLPAEAAPVAVTTDALTQVLLNLCLNAADALGGRGRVRLAAQPREEGCEITVEDDGPGIPADLREKIFEPFFTSKEAGSGTGLGLAVCAQILDASGGWIRVEEGIWGGARFVLWVPRVLDTHSFGPHSSSAMRE